MTDLNRMVRARRRNYLGQAAIVAVLGGLLGALTALAGNAYLSPPPLKVATIDVRGLVAQEIERLQATGMEAAKAQAYAELWGPILDKSVQGIADEYGVVLLVSPSVVAGAPDLTDHLKERMNSDLESLYGAVNP